MAYGSGMGGGALFGITYLLDLVLLLDIVVSMKTAVRTPTGVCVFKCLLVFGNYVYACIITVYDRESSYKRKKLSGCNDNTGGYVPTTVS